MIKCIIWDLDDTIWQGTFDESSIECILKPQIPDILKKSYECGIVNVIISKNDHEEITKKLKDLKIYDYFTYLFINWKRKYINIIELNRISGIEYEDMMIIDNSSFEIDEIKYYIPSINILNAIDYKKTYDYINMNNLTSEDKNRNKVYKRLIERNNDCKNFNGTKTEFLFHCNINVNVRKAERNDIKRINQLLHRTHKFNTTNCMLDEHKIINMINSSECTVLVCDMFDNYANYGTVGVAIINNVYECIINTFAVSCKVEGRGIGKFFLSYVINYVIKEFNKDIYCEYSINKKNHYMSVIFKSLGFIQLDNRMLIRTSKELIEYDKWIRINDNNTKFIINKLIKNLIGNNSINEVEQNLIESGIVDSMMLIELISQIEKVFNIYMDFDDLNIDNYKSIDSICELVNSKIRSNNE